MKLAGKAFWVVGLSVSMAAMLLGAWWAGRLAAPSAQGAVPPATHRPAAPASVPALPAAAPAASASASGPAEPSLAGQARRTLYAGGPLTGTEPDGAWELDARGQLKPALAVRRRFEHYLVARSDVAPAALRALVQSDAQHSLGPEGSAQVMDLWDKYLALRTHRFVRKVDLNQRDTWLPAFDERRTLRRQHLGAVWADAFFGLEEQAFVAWMAEQEGRANPRPDPGLPLPEASATMTEQARWAQREAQFGAAAAQRLAEHDAQWQDWEARLAQARQQWSGLQADPGLSPALRTAAMARMLQTQFSASERLRVRSLLVLP